MSEVEIRLIAIKSIPLVRKGIGLRELCRMIHDAVIKQCEFEDGDILVIAHTIVSKAEGRIHSLDEFQPDDEAKKVALEVKKDPRLISAILKEAKTILKKTSRSIIVELPSGLVCANAGIDLSNAGPGNIILLPEDPDESARIIKEELERLSKKRLGIIISDTHGRVLREGAINIGLGFAGFKNGIISHAERRDLFGRKLQTTEINIIDELASAAELLMGQADEGIPVVLIKGYKFEAGSDFSRSLIRKRKNQLFK
ncbi:MAG: coenzyme F420-0:L-glutamate ligase [Candidatus Helarchaeales archaeon]